MPHNVIDRSLRMVGCTAVLRWCIFFCAVLQGVGFRLRHISRDEN
nr:MAG TPA: hypothetical protein [Caudoviricetes sp.]